MNQVKSLGLAPEEVVQVYGFCIRTLHLPVISVMIIRVMRLLYNERAVQVPCPQFVGFGRYGHTELPMSMYPNQHMGSQFQI